MIALIGTAGLFMINVLLLFIPLLFALYLFKKTFIYVGGAQTLSKGKTPGRCKVFFRWRFRLYIWAVQRNWDSDRSLFWFISLILLV